MMSTASARGVLFVVSAIVLVSPLAQAEPAPFPVEPGMIGVEDAFPVDAGRTELEAGYRFSTAARAFDDDGDTFRRGDNTVHAGFFIATHGFTSFLDAGLGIRGGRRHDDGESERSVTGHRDLFVKAKWRFYGEGDAGLQLAYQGGLTAPTGKHDDDKNLSPGLGYWSFDQRLVATWIEGRWVGGVDLGFSLPFGDRNGARGVIGAGAGLGYQVTRWFKPEVELNFERDFDTSRRDAQVLGASLGLILTPTEPFRVDLGFRHGFYGRNADRRLSVFASLLWTF